ncbi:MAG TPA: hypothetical protein GXZ36_00905 [Firmicutes bacterium]|nr:hypothetical protein [Bacillota bacterium]
MDESGVNDILNKVHSQFTAYDQKLQEISEKVQSGLEAINEGVSLKLAALKDRLTGNAEIPEDFTGYSEAEQANVTDEQNTQEDHYIQEAQTGDTALNTEENVANEANSEENSFEPFEPFEIIETNAENHSNANPTEQSNVIKAALNKIEKIEHES